MRTLALTATLATALAGTGCIVTTDPFNGDLDLAWQFQNSDGQVAGDFSSANSGCGTAAITDVDLSVYEGSRRIVFQSFPCREVGSGIPRALVTSLPVGSYSYLVTAWRVDAPVFEDGGTFFIDANRTTAVDATLAVLPLAPLTVYFLQNGVQSCAGTPYIRYDLFAPNGAFIETATVPCAVGSYGFTVTNDQSTDLNYGFDVFAVDGAGASAASLYERCLQTVRHTGFPVTINLLPAPQAACGP